MKPLLRVPSLSVLWCLFAGVIAPAAEPAAPAAPSFPPFVIANSQLRVLPRTAAGRQYQLQVGLPASYASAPTRRYPVLYVTDGYWDFPTIRTSYDNLVYDRTVPEFIIVGLGYAGENPDFGNLRRWELSPVPVDDQGEASGHAADFLRTIEREIIPFIEREYRTDPSYRVLAGSSLGGLFTLYTMYTRPELFQAYVAASPAVRVHNDWLFGYEEAFARSGRPLPARLYMTGAENEWPAFLASIKRFGARLAQRKYPGFTYEFRVIDGERHAGTKAESYVRGMRFAFAPFAPETGPMQDHPY
jgi:predicted alpha/beta superfamily hydrolase